MDARTFAGEAEITLSVEQPVGSIALHAVDLDVRHAEVHAAGGMRRARVEVLPVSETIVLDLDGELAAGEARLVLRWTGRFTDGLRGLYLAGSVAATQFEAADARRVFPCFDEPGFKATWRLAVEAPKGVAVLSNGRPEREEDLGD